MGNGACWIDEVEEAQRQMVPHLQGNLTGHHHHTHHIRIKPNPALSIFSSPEMRFTAAAIAMSLLKCARIDEMPKQFWQNCTICTAKEKRMEQDDDDEGEQSFGK